MFIFFSTPLFIQFINQLPPRASSLRQTSSWQCNSVNIITEKCLSKDSVVCCWLLHKIDLQNRILIEKGFVLKPWKFLRSELRRKIFRSVILPGIIKKAHSKNCFWTKNWLPGLWLTCDQKKKKKKIAWSQVCLWPAPNIPTFSWVPAPPQKVKF